MNHASDDTSLRNGISLESVGAGIVIDNAATMLVSLLFVVPFIVSHFAELHDKEALRQAFVATMKGSQGLTLYAEVLGSLATVFGGYMAARLAGKHELLNAALVSIGCFVLYIYIAIMGSELLDPPRDYFVLATAPIAAMLGGYIRLKTKHMHLRPTVLSRWYHSYITPIYAGRIGRKSYLFSQCTLVVLFLIGLFVPVFTIGPIVRSTGINLGILIPIYIPCLLAAFIFYSYALTVRRVHDLNLTGWLTLAGYYPVVRYVFGIYTLFARGTTGDNKYGAPSNVFTLPGIFTGK